jgi:hypothetical protein
MAMHGLGKLIFFFGVVLVLVGGLLMVMPKIPFLGRLPGDILIKRDHFSFYFPLTTCIVISVVLTLIFRLFRK